MIRAIVDPAAGVLTVEPATAVVSLVNVGQDPSIRTSFCNQVHYFTSVQDAQPWLEQHPDAEVVPVADAYQIGAAISIGRLSRLAAYSSNASDNHRCC
jgi:alkylmercury lyase